MIIGLDIGGFQIKAVLYQNGRVLKFLETATAKEKKKILAAIFELIEKLKTKPIKGIGIGAAGALDFQKGTILHSPNIKALNGLKIKKIIEDKFKLPVLLDNDANCFLRGEMILGAGKGYKNAVGVTLGTGVGGAVAVDGQVITGANGAAGEIGSMIIQVSASGGPAVGGKRHLTFEDLCSVKWFRKHGLQDGVELFQQAKKGNKKAQEIFSRYGQGLGIGLANLVNILDPEVIILGGGISEAGKFFLASAKKQMRKLSLSPLAKKNINIKITKLGKKSGALGAALLFE